MAPRSGLEGEVVHAAGLQGAVTGAILQILRDAAAQRDHGALVFFFDAAADGAVGIPVGAFGAGALIPCFADDAVVIPDGLAEGSGFVGEGFLAVGEAEALPVEGLKVSAVGARDFDDFLRA